MAGKMIGLSHRELNCIVHVRKLSGFANWQIEGTSASIQGLILGMLVEVC